jgi:hypothetical protein
MADKLIDPFISPEKEVRDRQDAIAKELIDPFTDEGLGLPEMPEEIGDVIRAQADPTKFANELMEDTAHSITFNQDGETVGNNRELLKNTANDEFLASVKKQQSLEALTGMAPVGMSMKSLYPGGAVDPLTQEDMMDELDRAKKTGFLTEGEVERAERAIKSGEFNDIPMFMRGKLSPEQFYDATAGDVAERMGRGAVAGAIGVTEQAIGAIQYAGGKSAVGKSAKYMADVLQDLRISVGPQRPDFLADVSGGFASSAIFLVPGVGGAKVAQKIGNFNKAASIWFGASFMTVVESGTIGGGAYRDVLEKGGTQEEAEGAFRFGFFANLPISLVANKILITKVKGRAAKSIISGSAEEALQAVIEPIARGEGVDFTDILYQGGIGGIVSGGSGKLLDFFQATPTPEMDAETQALFDETKENAIDEGKSAEQADIEATRTISETEGGEQYINQVADAADAALKFEASLGQNLTEEDVGLAPEAPATTQAAFDEVTAPESQLTEDEAVERILGALEQEQAEAAVVTQEAALIQEALPTAQNIEQVDPQTIPDLGVPGARAFKATMPNGSDITVVTGADIQITPEKIEQIRKTYVEPGNIAGVTEEVLRSGNFIIAGQNQVIGENNIILLSKDAAAPKAVINEEVYELAEKSILTPEEITTLQEEFGESIENRSKAYAAWDGTTETANGLLEKVRDFFKGILNRFRAPKLTPEEVFRRVREGEVFEREARPEGIETFAIQPGRPAFENEQPVFKDDKLVPELTDVQGQVVDAPLFEGKGVEYWTTADVAREAMLAAPNTNPGQPKGVLYRGTTGKRFKNNKILLDQTKPHQLNKDETKDIDAVWFTTSYADAMDYAEARGGTENGVIVAIPTASLPNELYVQNVTTPGDNSEVWIGIPADIDLTNAQIQDLTTAQSERTMEIEREVPDDIDVRAAGERVRGERGERIPGAARRGARPAEVEPVAGIPEAEPGRPAEPTEAERAQAARDAAIREGLLGPEETFNVQLTPEGKPIFHPPAILAEMRSQLETTYPAYMDENPTWSEDEVRRALFKAEKGQTLTAREFDIVKASIAEASANFYQEVLDISDEFINPVDVLEDGELDRIVEEGMRNLVAGLKVEEVVELTPEQQKIKKREKTIREQGKELKRLAEVLGDKTQVIWGQSKDIARQAEEIKAGKKANKQLTDKIERRDRQIEKLREKGREAAKAVVKPEAVKTRVRRVTGQVREAALIREDVALRESIKKSVQAARAAAREGRTEGVEAERARLQEIISRKELRQEQTALRQKIRKQIRKMLQASKPKKQAGKVVGKFTPEAQKQLDMLRNASRLKSDEAAAKIATNLEKYPDTLPPDDVVIENRVLSMVAGFEARTISELESLRDEVAALIEDGETIAELKKFNRQARNERAVIEAVDVVTGGKGLPASISAGEKAARFQMEKIEGLTDRAKRWFSTTGTSIVGWKDILDILSRLDPSKPFESRLSKLGDVLEVKNREKAGTREFTERMQDMYKEAYGLETPREVLGRIKEDSKPIELGTFTDRNNNEIELVFTRAEARKRWMEMQDPSLEQTFAEGMAYTEDMKAAIAGALTPQDKAFAQKQLDFYAEYYDTINEVYREQYGIDLAKNDNYSPIRREGISTEEPLGFGDFLQEINLRGSVAGGSLKARVANILPIQQQSDVGVLEQHTAEMEHFKAWAARTRELNALFGNPELRTAIKLFHGNNVLGVIDNFIADFTRNGTERSGKLRWLDKLRGNIARSVLAVKASIGAKQLTSFIAYADAIPVTDFVRGVNNFWQNPIENTRFIMKHSELLKGRGQSMERDIQTAHKSDEFSAWRSNQSFLNALMLNVQIGDQGAIVMGGWPVIKYHMDRGASAEEAIRKFEQVTESTQQSADLSELSVFQRAGSFAKLFTMFLSSPNQYVRKEIAAVRNLFAGRQSIKQTAKTLAIYHVMLPMLFQFVSDGFTWDEDEQKRAIIMGPLNGIFILGDILDGITRHALGMRVFDDEVPVLSIKDDAIKAMKLLEPGDLKDEETLRAIRGFAGLVGALTGVPLKQAVDIGAGVDEILTGDFDKGAAQVLGWSPSVAEKISRR